MHEPLTARRRFLAAAIALSGAAASLSATALLRSSRAWAQAGAGGRRAASGTMVEMARRLFPHEAISDAVYAELLDAALAATAGDESFANALAAAETALDSRQAANFIDLDAASQVAALQAIQNEPFFAAIQGAVRNGLYNHRAFWEHIGYEGPSFARGGYLNRGAGEIDWLPEVD